MADDGEDALLAAALLDLSVDDEGVARQAEAADAPLEVLRRPPLPARRDFTTQTTSGQIPMAELVPLGGPGHRRSSPPAGLP